MAKILVTGGLGFVGSNLVRELRGRGHDTWIADIVHSADSRSIRCDVSRFRQVEKMFEDDGFEYVYHAAAEYGRWNGEDYYENLWSTNVVGTKNVIRMQESKKFRMVFFSSAEVYADFDGKMTEDVMDKVPLKQMNDYAMSKWVGELQVANSANMFRTESIRVRPFNIYGPGEHYTPYRGFVPKFVYCAMNDRPYVVYQNHKRTLEYVDDVCRALANIVDKFKPDEVYNLGGDRQHEIREVSDAILKHTGKDDSKVTYKREEGFTTRVKTPDSSKAKTDLDFRLAVPMEEGINRTVAWFRSTYGNGG